MFRPEYIKILYNFTCYIYHPLKRYVIKVLFNLSISYIVITLINLTARVLVDY